MAKAKKGNGILAKPPVAKQQLTRVSPGVYRDAKGGLVKSASGGGQKTPQKQKEKNKKEKTPKYTGLNQQQNTLINQQTEGDTQLGNIANQQLGAIEQSYNQPFDYSQLPTAPWEAGQDAQGMAQKYQEQVYQNYLKNAQTGFQQQNDELEQQLANRGIPIGSDLYNKQKKALFDAQEGQKQNLQAQALQDASGYAGTFNTLGTQNFQNAYNFGQTQRDASLADYNKLNAAKSPMMLQDLAYSQTLGAQNNQAKNQLYVNQHSPRGGGGGGGGDPYMGFGSAQALWDAQNANKLKLAYGLRQIEPQASSPSYTAQVGGGILSGIAQGAGYGLFS